MKKLITSLFVLIATVIGSVGAFAYDFEVDGLYYNVISLPDLTCALTNGDTPYAGDIVIPSTVTYKNRTLSVVEIAGDAFTSNANVTSVIIPNSVTEIGKSAFYGCTSLTSIEIPNSVTTIGERAFYGCTSLTSIVIPNSVTTIGESAFSGCTSLTSVEIPNSVTTIGESVFYCCTSLTSVEIPNSVTTIPTQAFYGCTSLTSIEIPNSVTKIGMQAFIGCTSLTSVEIPTSVTTIVRWAFSHCTSLRSIKIPNSVRDIYDEVFLGCTSLTSIKIPNSVKEIYPAVFSGCTSLTSVEIPNSVTTIRGRAFYGCTSLTSIEIPTSVTRIDEGAFKNCNNLNTVHFLGGQDSKSLSWDIVKYDYADKSYYSISPWDGCDNLSNLIIEHELDPKSSLNWLKSYTYVWPLMFQCAFDAKKEQTYPCPIANITFGCKTMPSDGICEWTLLETITFTDAVEEIEAKALNGCSGLKAIYCQGMTPPNLGSGSFTQEQFLELPVYVPKGSLAAYLAAPEWDNFWELQEYDPETSGINDLQIERPDMTNDVYNMQGVCIKRAATDDDIHSLAPGIYIINGKKVLIR